jgi:hypothetical protein
MKSKISKLAILVLGSAITLTTLTGCGKGNFFGPSTSKKLEGIVYDQSREKVLLKGKQGGKLSIYTEANECVSSYNFTDNEDVEVPAGKLAESKYKAVYEKGGESYSTDFILERK